MTIAKRLHGLFTNGLSASRDLAKKAGHKANDLAIKGAIKLESSSLKSRADKLLARLGTEAFHKFADMDKATISRDNPQISEILDEIKGLHAKIALKEKEYSAIDEPRAPSRLKEPS